MSVSEESSDEENFDPELLLRNFENEAQLVINNLLPPKSKKMYLKAYEDFMEWKNKNSASFDENVFLVYFEQLSQKFKPPTLWSIWSKLKTTLNIKEKINLDKYNMLKAFLKNKSKGYKPKKSKTLTLSQVNTFLQLADDIIYLATKVILIFGFFGALRCEDIVNLKTTDIEDLNNHLIVTVNESKTYVTRNFIISKEYYNVVKKYTSLRPDNMPDNRFFVSYQKGKCTRQFIGKNKIRELPSLIATFLQLPDAKQYTGHCYRRSSTTALSNSGASLIQIKNHGGWKSDNVAQGYIDFSIANRRKIFDMISNSDDLTENHFLKHPPIHINHTTSNSSKISTVQMEKVPVGNLHASPISENQNDANNFCDNMPSDEVLDEPSSKIIRPTSTHDPKDQKIHNPSSTAAADNNADLAEPPPKKTKSNSENKTKNEDSPSRPSSGLFQNCQVTIQTMNVNNYYYCSCKTEHK